jgi:tryptophan synthase alpha chain
MEEVTHYLDRLRKMKLKNPIMVGFGIKDKQSFHAACLSAEGAIIGTAYIKALEADKNVSSATRNFLNTILN